MYEYKGVKNPLTDLFLAHRSPRRMHRFLHHLEVYDRLFSRFRGTPVRFLEIGVTEGGAFEMWRQYFGPDAQLFGCDIQDRRDLLETLGAKGWCGDQADPEFWKVVLAEQPQFDIVIDDGGHEMHQMRTTFEAMFPALAPFGVYAVEDIHTCYRAQYGGAYKGSESFVEYLKNGWDFLHCGEIPGTEIPAAKVMAEAFGFSVYTALAIVEKRPGGSVGSPAYAGMRPDGVGVHQDDV